MKCEELLPQNKINAIWKTRIPILGSSMKSHKYSPTKMQSCVATLMQGHATKDWKSQPVTWGLCHDKPQSHLFDQATLCLPSLNSWLSDLGLFCFVLS